MATTKKAEELVGQLTGKAIEALGLWADANQKILRELADLPAGTAKEGVRLYAELQSNTVEAVKEGQAYWLRKQSELAEWQKDPLGWYQKAVLEGVEETQRAFKLLEGNAQAVSESVERLQILAQQTSKQIQQTFVALGSEIKGLYTTSVN